LDAFLRGECDVRRAAVARLSAGHAQAQLAPHHLHLLRICTEHSDRNDPNGTTKTAQLAISRGLAKLTRGTGVTANAVLPGPTMSEGAPKGS
jgi:NAD(P)-dependent dehydrogenase (short-subunit alcohol dehydrogenase family)